MQIDDNVSILLKKLIKSRYNSLTDLAKKLQITNSTLTRNIHKHSRQFLIQLKDAGIPVPDDLINPDVKTITAYVSKRGVEGFMVKENNIEYLLDEIKQLKAENYDLKKQLEKYKNE
jgi:D-ribose pyranose/furanose isomerase RbsD